jgi:ABC-type Fe3+-hydroxamate transport system substrate-binding protein
MFLVAALVSVASTACTGWASTGSATSPSAILVIQTTPNTVELNGPTVVVAGRSASFSYVVGIGPAGAASLVLSWGDGTSSTIPVTDLASTTRSDSGGATFTGVARHIFTTSGPYQVSMTLTDAVGRPVSASVDVAVG